MRKILALFSIVLSVAFLTSSSAKADSTTGTSFEITKTATPSTVSPSSTVNFTVSLKNISTGGLNQTPQTVVDTLPEGFAFANDAKLTKLDGTQVAFAPSSVSGQVVTWTFQGEFSEAIPTNQNVVISYAATASATIGTYENNACLTAPENICAKASIIVQTSPTAGLRENLALAAGVGAIAVIFGILLRRKPRASFEDALISNE
jgi:fimbrial isopeptide formation D2 family protein